MMEYKIETIEDVLNCVNDENLENFLVDFRAMLEDYNAILALARVSASLVGEDITKKKNSDIVKSKEFIWVDDGKHDKHITIEVETQGGMR